MTVDTKRERRHGRHTRWVRAATSAGVVALGVLLVPWGMDAGVSAVAASHDKAADAMAVAQKRAAAKAKKTAAAGNGTSAATRNAGTKSITLNFRDADIQSVVGAFGLLLNRTFVIDQRVTGKINLETPKPVPARQAYDMLLATLRLHGFTIVDTGSFSKVVPEADAKLQYGPVTVGQDGVSGGDRIVTQIFRINYESATNLVPVLRPLIGANNTITAYASNNSLIVTDYASNLQRIARIIATIDSPSTSEVEIVALKHSLATDVAVSVAKLLDESQRGVPGDASQRVTVLADPRINSILIRSPNVAKVNLAKTLIARLDQTGDDAGRTHVVYLRNAEAIKLVETLRAVLGTEGRGASAAAPSASSLQPPSTSTPSSAGAASSAALQASASTPVTVSGGGAVIAADPTTNSLIITAPEPVYRNLRNVIEKLDSRRAQVFIESLIVEVSAEKAAEMGIQWQFLNAPEGTTRVIGGTNLPGRSAGGNILDATANLSAVGQGLNLGLVRGTTELPGVGTVLNLGLLARALETQANANILATPTLLTLDNEEARIIIGQNVPFITGQFTATGTGGASVSPFQTIERRDVGTTLRVKPQISEGGAVKMAIFQEVSSVQDTSLAAGLITKRRAIESHVIVDDGQIVVLGGLIEEKIENGEQAVPGLGSIPGIGQLFRYDTRKLVKTNLLVFLRPVVIRDGNAAYRVTADRYDYIRQLRGDSRAAPHWLLPDYTPGDMPNMPPPPEGTKPTAKQGSAPAPITRVLEGMAAVATPAAAPQSVPMASPQPSELYLN